MNKITKNMTSNNLLFSFKEKTDLFEKLYNHMATMQGYSQIFKKHNATSTDLEKLSSIIQWAGYDFFKTDYLPVVLVSFGKPLDFLLSNKQKIFEYPKYSLSLIDEAINKLYS